jgi:uncharacterized protein (TIGR00269 family)
MLDFDSRIAIGVSGGKDSLSLLQIMEKIESEQPKSELIAISIDEGIQGYRDEALSLAKNATKKLNIEHVIFSFKDLFDTTMEQIATREKDMTPCSFCGVLRRRALNLAAKDVEADRLATGHTLDDMAQTTLLNILRGDIKKLDSYHPGGESVNGFVRRIKPLCEIPERETTFYAYLNNIEFQSIPCPFSDESMRTEIRRFLNRMELNHPSTLFTIFNGTIRLALTVETIGQSKKCKFCGEPTLNETCRVCTIMK